MNFTRLFFSLQAGFRRQKSLEHKLRYKKNLNPEVAEKLAEDLELCAKVSAQLDENMLQIRNRIAEAGASEE